MIHNTSSYSDLKPHSVEEIEISMSKDRCYASISKLDFIEKESVRELIDIGKEASDNLLTSLLRRAQIVASFAEPVLNWLGYGIIAFSFLSVLLGPTPTVTLLSVLTGMVLGSMSFLLGKIINVAGAILGWCEKKWTNSYFDSENKTLNSLRAWYSEKNPAGCKKDIKLWLNTLKRESVIDINENKSNLIEILDTVKGHISSFCNAKDTIEAEKDAGGLELLTYIKS